MVGKTHLAVRSISKCRHKQYFRTELSATKDKKNCLAENMNQYNWKILGISSCPIAFIEEYYKKDLSMQTRCYPTKWAEQSETLA